VEQAPMRLKAVYQSFAQAAVMMNIGFPFKMANTTINAKLMA